MGRRIFLKKSEEIEKLRASNLMVGKAHEQVALRIKPGVKTSELDEIAKQFILDNGATPSFLNYHGFPNTLCISVNDVVVHGIPSDYELKEGDIISVDCGVYLDGYHGDSAFTYAVGEVKKETWELMKATRESLYEGINAAINGNRIGDIGFAIEDYVKKRGYTVVREMTGHGVGRNLHEAPTVPNYGKRGRGKRINNGLTIAIEPMINLGKQSIYIEDDGWTVRTSDGKPSAHYEHSIAIVDGKADILSTFEYIENAIKQNDYISSP